MVNLSPGGRNSGELMLKYTLLLVQNVAHMHLCTCVIVWARTRGHACMHAVYNGKQMEKTSTAQVSLTRSSL